MSHKRKLIYLGLGAVALVALTAGVSAVVTQKVIEDKQTATVESKARGSRSSEKVTWNGERRLSAANSQQNVQQPACDDGNIVGTIVGGLGGGVVGSQIGSGNGQTVATIGGTLGGAYLGNQYLPTRNVTCR